MSNADKLSLPYAARPCPVGMPTEVWRAFGAAADARSRDDWQTKWAAFQAVHATHYNSDGTRKLLTDNESIPG